MFVRTFYSLVTRPVVKVYYHLSYLPCSIVQSPVEFAIYNYTTADTCSKGHKNNILITPRSTKSVLGNCHHISIIININRQTGLLFN